MKIVLRRAKSGDVLVVVRFEKDSNFDVKKMEWVPRLDEIDLIVEVKKRVDNK